MCQYANDIMCQYANDIICQYANLINVPIEDSAANWHIGTLINWHIIYSISSRKAYRFSVLHIDIDTCRTVGIDSKIERELIFRATS